MEKRFVSLYTAEADAVFRYCLIRTSSREVALDISQDAFMRFWDALMRQTSISNDKAFLFKITRNLIIDWYRKKKSISLEALGESDDDTERDVLDRLVLEDSVYMQEEFNAEGRYVIEKIRELEPQYQQMLYLRFVEDMKPKEIAEVLGESVNVISVRITRAIEKLRKIVDDTQHER
jgi:RNA polymerase sigma-70 factor (ECF subfamily)